jgi:hypothetical protein
MRWARSLLGVLASLISVSAGAATSSEAPAESERMRAPAQRLETAGYAAWGRSFYIWEEDPRQGREWAAELALREGSPLASTDLDPPVGPERPAR